MLSEGKGAAPHLTLTLLHINVPHYEFDLKHWLQNVPKLKGLYMQNVHKGLCSKIEWGIFVFVWMFYLLNRNVENHVLYLCLSVINVRLIQIN